MTRQMADESLSDVEVLRVIEAAYFAVPDNRGDLAEQLHHAEKYVAALQAERDQARKYATTLAQAMLRKHYAEDAPQWEPCPDLLGVLTQIDNMTTGLTRTERAERAESALEALRGQVAGLVASLRAQADRAEQRFEQKFAEGVADVAAQESGCAIMARQCADQLDALLAIKERMG